MNQSEKESEVKEEKAVYCCGFVSCLLLYLTMAVERVYLDNTMCSPDTSFLI